MGFHQLATRAQALALKAMRATLDYIQHITEIKHQTLQYIFKRARSHSWDPVSHPLILSNYIIDAPHTGSKVKITRKFKQRILKKVTTNQYNREKSCTYIAAECGCSTQSVWQVLWRHGYHKTKPTKKPYLSQETKEAHLQFTLQYKHWTIEDWKAVIWSNETGVILGHRRGGYKLWCLAKEKVNKKAIQPCFPKATEFMFWGAFSYDQKAPCHI